MVSSFRVGDSIGAYPVLLDNLNDLLAIPHEHMGDGASNSQTVTDLGNDLGTGEPWQSLFSQTRGIEFEVLVKDEKLIVSSPVLVEELLGEEGEALAIPDIHGEAGAERDPS